MRIGYIGLGNMGAALARRLLLAHPLLVYDQQPGGSRNVRRCGSERVRHARGSGSRQRCRIPVRFPTSNHVRDVLFGEDGIIALARPGTLIVDQTTGDPAATRAMADELAARGLALVDAPVSGGAIGAAAGTIAIMIGASDAHFIRLRPVLEAISPNLFHAGGVGTGHAMKLVNNLVSGAQRLLTFEAVALAARNGIDPARACEVLLAGGARNSFIEKFMLPRVVKGDLVSPFSLGLMEKDIGLACDLGAASGVPMAYGRLTLDLYRHAVLARGPQAEVNTAALVLDQQAGTNVVPANPRVA